MKTFTKIMVILMVSLIPSSVLAENCYCKKFPFQPDPPCFDLCSVNLVLKTDLERLQAVLDLPDSMTEKIIRIRHMAFDSPLKKLSDIQMVLNKFEYEYVYEKLRRMSKAQFMYLRNSE